MNDPEGVKMLVRQKVTFCLLVSIFSVLFVGHGFGQLVTSCPNSDFCNGTFDNWIGCYGYFNTPCQYSGLDTNTVAPWPNGNAQCNGTPHNLAHCPPLHSIIPGPGTMDPNTGDSLITVYPGEAFSAKLGHATGGTHGSELKFNIFVTNSTYLFIYRYAIVLQNPLTGHTLAQQPSFEIRVQDSLGNLIDSCGYYNIKAKQGVPGWHNHWIGTEVVIWKEWSTVGMSLANSLGHHVTVVFIARDCSLGGHYGYAYVSAYCNYLQVHTSMCEGDTSATLTAPPGFTYLWSTGDTTSSIVVPHPTTGSSYNCTLTAYNGCKVTITDTLTYTVIHANFHASGNGCYTGAVQFTDSSYVSQNSVENWRWDFGDATPIVTGIANPLHTFPSPGTYNVTLIAYSTEGCSDTITKSVSVNPLPDVIINSSTPAICSGQTTNILLSSSIPSATFTWTVTGSSPNLSGFTATGTGNILQTITNSGFTTETVTFSILGTVGGCTDPSPTLYVVTVYPVPNVVITSTTPDICSGQTTNILLSSQVSNVSFGWTAASSSPNLIGFATSGAGNILQTITNTGFTTETVTFAITSSANACPGNTASYVVTVYPVPDLSNTPLTKQICSNTQTNINLTSNIAGTLFTWTASGSSGNVSGYSNNSTPTVTLNQTLVNSGYSIENVTFHITPHANGCIGTARDFVVAVFPDADLSNTPLYKSICNNTSTSVTLTSHVTGTLFTWTCAPGSPNVFGYSDNSTPTTILNQTLVNSGYNIETVTYHITPKSNGCNGTISNYVVTVYPTTDAYFSPTAQTICSAQTTNVQILSHTTGTTFTWTVSASSQDVTGYTPGGGSLIQQNLTNSGFTFETVTYSVIPSVNNCIGTSNDVIITVNPPPVVTLTTCWDPVTRSNAKPFPLKGGIPLGGTYTGPGVSSGIFHPSVPGVGTFTLVYTYTNQYSCTRAANKTITVIGAQSFTCGNTLTDIRDNKQYPTIQISTQCWMAANLNYGTMIPGSISQRDNCLPEKYCLNDITGNCEPGTVYYQWDEVMKFETTEDVQGFCPPGWHIPKESEWNTLFSVYISNGFAGSPLKYDGYSGFNAFLSGVRFENVTWSFDTFAVMYWSSSAHGLTKAWAHGMNSYDPSVSYYPALRSNAFPVRCLKD